jgi:hypothetical protein
LNIGETLMAKRSASTRSKTADAGTPGEAKPKRARASAEDASPPAPPQERAAEQAPVGPPADVTEDDIRRRAYDRYLARGGNHGLHFDDWLEAEKELRHKK